MTRPAAHGGRSTCDMPVGHGGHHVYVMLNVDGTLVIEWSPSLLFDDLGQLDDVDPSLGIS